MATFFVCPLCGRQRPVNGWTPFLLGDEVILRDGSGRGRGAGFEYTNERTAQDDPDDLDLEAMARRCLVIVGICLAADVKASDLIDYVPEELIETIVEERAE